MPLIKYHPSYTEMTLLMIDRDNYIYLHFFDRELRKSVSNKSLLNDKKAESIVKLAILMSDYPLYVSFSHMYESLDEFPKTIAGLFELEKYGLIKMLTNSKNIEEFISSRRSLYLFDKSRYSHYFESSLNLWPSNVCLLASDTTSILRHKLISALSDKKILSNESFQYQILERLIKNKKDAITFSFFKNLIDTSYEHNDLSDEEFIKFITNLSYEISSNYTLRYLAEFDGTIITGIPGFTLYDHLAKSKLDTNYHLFYQMFSSYFQKYSFEKEIEFRISNDFIYARKLIKLILQYLSLITNDNIMQASVIVRKYCYLYNTVYDNQNLIYFCNGMLHYLVRKCQAMGCEVKKMHSKILLVVATQLELSIILDKIKEKWPISPMIGKISYFTTVVGDSCVYIIKSQMGQGGSGGSILTIEETIQILNPDFVIMSGVAWGSKSEKQKIGDVLVSTKVWDYDLQRANSDGSLTPRGAITPSSPQLIQMFEVACAYIRSFKIEYGLIASGSVLYDNYELMERLKQTQPEIIGGDMESAGMAAVCSRKQVKWIMVKGICDWGFNKDSHKKKYQTIAASNSSEAILTLLAQLQLT